MTGPYGPCCCWWPAPRPPPIMARMRAEKGLSNSASCAAPGGGGPKNMKGPPSNPSGILSNSCGSSWLSLQDIATRGHTSEARQDRDVGI